MATDNVTALPGQRAASARIKPQAVYFDTAEGEPCIEHLVFALDGVCSALDNEEMSLGDHDQLNRIANLSCAARILARHLQDRMTSKPPTKKQLNRAERYLAFCDATRTQPKAAP